MCFLKILNILNNTKISFIYSKQNNLFLICLKFGVNYDLDILLTVLQSDIITVPLLLKENSQ